MRDSAAIHSSGAGTSCGCGGPCFSSLNSVATAGSEKSDGKPYPARKVSRSSTVIGRTAGTTSSTGPSGVRTTVGDASSGSQCPTGSSSAIRPSSTSIMTAAATTGLVIDAIRKIESRAIGAVPSTSAEPTACTSIRSPRATRPTAPGTGPSLMCVSRMSCRLVMRSTFSDCAVGIKTPAPARNHRAEAVESDPIGRRPPCAPGPSRPDTAFPPRPAGWRHVHQRSLRGSGRRDRSGPRRENPRIDRYSGPHR